MPEIKKRYEEFHNKGFEIIGISIDQDKTALDRYLQENPLSWIMLHDPKQILFKQCYGNGVPHYILLDRNGKVIMLHAYGELLKTKLMDLLTK
jgi:peroxiredoxin